MRKLLSNKGMAMLKAVFIMMIMLIVISFMFQIFSVLNIASNVKEAAEKSAMSLCAVNMPKIYNSLREGNTKIEDETGTPFYSILTAGDMNLSLKETLGLTQTAADELTAQDSNGAVLYSIRSLRVDTGENAAGQLQFIVRFDLEIYTSGLELGGIVIPMEVVSGYSYKF